jgi:hypothetical protein
MYRPERRARGDNGVSANGTATPPASTIDLLELLFRESEMQCRMVRLAPGSSTPTNECGQPVAWTAPFPCAHSIECCRVHHRLALKQKTVLLCGTCDGDMLASTAPWRHI